MATAYAILKPFRSTRRSSTTCRNVPLRVDGIRFTTRATTVLLAGSGTPAAGQPPPCGSANTGRDDTYNILRAMPLATGEIWGASAPEMILPAG